MGHSTILVDRADGVATITLNRPEARNAIDLVMRRELLAALDDLEAEAATRVVILTGAGEKAFVAGADINELAVQRPVQGKEHALRGQHVFDLIENMGKPVIAAINGYALGGGCELAMACTLRVAAETAKLGQPEINLGILPGYGGTQRLARLVGKGVALDLLLSGRQITAAEALQIGLVNRVVPAGAALPEARLLAERLAAGAPLAIREIKRLVDQGAGLSLTEALGLERDRHRWLVGTDDAREGVQAFLERRAPKFRAR